MELQLIREALRLEQPLGTGRATAMVTGEVTLPGGLREETRDELKKTSLTNTDSFILSIGILISG